MSRNIMILNDIYSVSRRRRRRHAPAAIVKTPGLLFQMNWCANMIYYYNIITLCLHDIMVMLIIIILLNTIKNRTVISRINSLL